MTQRCQIDPTPETQDAPAAKIKRHSALPMDWSEAGEKALSSLDIRAEATALGIQFTSSNPSADGWLACPAIDREDSTPSAAVNVGDGKLRGRYKDLGNGQQSMSFWDLAATLGNFGSDWRVAREHYVNKAGVKLNSNGKSPDKQPKKLDEKIEFYPWSKLAAEGWAKHKEGIEASSLEAFGAKQCKWAKFYCIALPGWRGPGEPTAWVLYRSDGNEFPAFGDKLKARKIHNVSGSTDSWIIHCTWAELETVETVWKVEGPSDAIALYSLGLPPNSVVITNTSGASALPSRLPMEFAAGKRVHVIGDADEAGEKGARQFAAEFARAGAADVRLIKLPYAIEAKHGKDLRDWINEGRTFAQLEELAALAERVTAESAGAGDEDARLEIDVTTDEHAVNDAGLQALANDPEIYQRAGKMVRVIDAADTGPAIVDVPIPTLRERLTLFATYWKPTEKDRIQVRPPEWSYKAIHARGHYPCIRTLNGITRSPIIRRDGSILQEPGFDVASGMVYVGSEASRLIPEIPSKPTANQIKDSLAALFDVLVDFPFAGPVHQSAAIAYLLTPLSMSAHEGPAPLFLVDANTPGTGKGLLSTVVSLIATGLVPSPTPYPRDDEEMRKMILALAQAGRPMVHLDNIVGTLGGASLDACLTSPSYSGRLLGTNTTIDIPFRAVWSATGNNVVLGADTSRRTCWIRLESREERPDEREGFRYPKLVQHVKTERPKLLAAALTLLRGYFAAGRPDQGLKSWGSFESWGDIVRNTLVWAGLPDPAESRTELRSQSDKSSGALRVIIENLGAIDDGRGVTSSMIEQAINDEARARNDLAVMALKEAFSELCGERITNVSIGRKLQLLKGRIVGTKTLAAKKYQGACRWIIEDAATRETHSIGDLFTDATETTQTNTTEDRFGEGCEGGEGVQPLHTQNGTVSHAYTHTFIAPGVPDPHHPHNPHRSDQSAERCSDCRAKSYGETCQHCGRSVCFACRSAKHKCPESF